VRIERLFRIAHDLRHRHDRASGGHHGRGAHLEYLQDVRRIAGAESGDGRGHRLGIGALEDRHHLVFLLAVVELAGERIELLAERAAHRMPPDDLGLRVRGTGKQAGTGEHGQRLDSHAFSSSRGAKLILR